MRLLDERQHIAHAEDARRHAVGVEHLDVGQLFAYAAKLDRLARHRPDGQRRAAARVAVELGQHDAGDVHDLVELLRDVDRVLTGHRVDDQQDLGRIQGLFEPRDLVHQLFVDVKPAGGVDDDDVVVVLLRLFERALDDLLRIDLPHLEHRNAGVLADDLQLLDRRRTIDVARDEHRVLALLAQHHSQLAAHRRLAAALKSAHQDDRRRLGRDLDLAACAAHHRDQFFVDNLDDLLGRVEPFEHAFADSLLGHLGDEIFDDRKVDVRFEQRDADLAHCLLDFKLGQRALVAELAEDVRQPVAERRKCSHS